MTNSPIGTPPSQVIGITSPLRDSPPDCYSLAVMPDHTVMAWGRALQVGNGSTVDSYTAVPVAGLTNVAAVSAGWTQVLALKTDGTVWVWGSNHWNGAFPGYGILGTGTMNDEPRPVQ